MLLRLLLPPAELWHPGTQEGHRLAVADYGGKSNKSRIVKNKVHTTSAHISISSLLYMYFSLRPISLYFTVRYNYTYVLKREYIII